MLNLTASIAYKIVDRDLCDFKIMVGLGVTAMAHIFRGGTEQPDGVSELEIFG